MSAVSILEALEDPQLFGAAFDLETWATWIVFLKAVFGLPMSTEELEVYRAQTRRAGVLDAPAREAWCVVGRRGGKSRIAALIAVYVAAFRDYTTVLAPGEKATVAVIAADRQQARVVFRYITGALDAVPMLAALVTRRTAHAVELRGRVVIEVHTCSFRTTRGYAFAAVIADEVAFWKSETSASPDVEVLNAVRPGLATLPGSLLVCISSPYARRGALWDAYRRHFGHDGASVLVWQATTRAMNPTVPEVVIEDALAADEVAARSEYLAEFRSDLEAFVTRETLEAVTIPGRQELPPQSGVGYVAFVDPSGGSSDSFAVAIAHREADADGPVAVLDVAREWRAPFSPAAVARACTQLLARYRVTRVSGDRYGGEWPREAFARHGVTYEPSALSKADLYANCLPLLNSSRVALLDLPVLAAQFMALERRTSRAGRELIDHPPGRRDDLANAVAGALVRCTTDVANPFIRRRSLLAAMRDDTRRHPFSLTTTTLHDDVRILPDAFHVDVDRPRALHITVSADQQAAGLAIAYVQGLQPVTRTVVSIDPRANGAAGADAGEPNGAGPCQVAPVFVLEAVLGVVAEPGGDVQCEELLEFAVRLHEYTGLPIKWVTASELSSVVAQQLLRHHGFITGELSPEKSLRGYHELRAAIYDGRFRAYTHPPLLDVLGRLELHCETGRIELPGPVVVGRQPPGMELADAVAGTLYVLATRTESWAPPPRPLYITGRLGNVNVTSA